MTTEAKLEELMKKQFIFNTKLMKMPSFIYAACENYMENRWGGKASPSKMCSKTFIIVTESRHFVWNFDIVWLCGNKACRTLHMTFTVGGVVFV